MRFSLSYVLQSEVSIGLLLVTVWNHHGNTGGELSIDNNEHNIRCSRRGDRRPHHTSGMTTVYSQRWRHFVVDPPVLWFLPRYVQLVLPRERVQHH